MNDMKTQRSMEMFSQYNFSLINGFPVDTIYIVALSLPNTQTKEMYLQFNVIKKK